MPRASTRKQSRKRWLPRCLRRIKKNGTRFTHEATRLYVEWKVVEEEEEEKEEDEDEDEDENEKEKENGEGKRYRRIIIIAIFAVRLLEVLLKLIR